MDTNSSRALIRQITIDLPKTDENELPAIQQTIPCFAIDYQCTHPSAKSQKRFGARALGNSAVFLS